MTTQNTIPYGLSKEDILKAVHALVSKDSIDHGIKYPTPARMKLRSWDICDFTDLIFLHKDKRVREHLIDSPITNLSDAAAFFYLANALIRERPGYGLWHTSDKASGEFLGFFSLVPNIRLSEIELGVRLAPAAWGRGYALEGGRAILDWAFYLHDMPRVLGRSSPNNRVVHLLLERLGFKDAGIHTSASGIQEKRHVITAEQWYARNHRKTKNYPELMNAH